MGFKEIAMIVVALILGGILALNVAPSITASGNATKSSVILGEIDSIETAGKMWMANNSTSGTFTGINAIAMQSTIPNLTASGVGATSVFTSKLGGITYNIIPATTTSADDSTQITITGLGTISGAETSVRAALTAQFSAAAVTGVSPIVILKARG